MPQKLQPSSAPTAIVEWRDAFGCEMVAEGFVPATQKIYARTLDRFAAGLKGLSPADATVKDAKAYRSTTPCAAGHRPFAA